MCCEAWILSLRAPSRIHIRPRNAGYLPRTASAASTGYYWCPPSICFHVRRICCSNTYNLLHLVSSYPSTVSEATTRKPAGSKVGRSCDSRRTSMATTLNTFRSLPISSLSALHVSPPRPAAAPLTLPPATVTGAVEVELSSIGGVNGGSLRY